jgi:UDP-glucose 4-epimerase
LSQGQQGGSLVIFGGGGQTRDFVYVDDVVDALVAAATASDVDRRIINVGSGRETSINELAALVARAVEREVEVLHSPAESGGVARLCADISAARRLLGYDPKVGLARGLRMTLERDPKFGG